MFLQQLEELYFYKTTSLNSVHLTVILKIFTDNLRIEIKRFGFHHSSYFSKTLKMMYRFMGFYIGHFGETPKLNFQGLSIILEST